jgi:hypothetical protein
MKKQASVNGESINDVGLTLGLGLPITGTILMSILDLN